MKAAAHVGAAAKTVEDGRRAVRPEFGQPQRGRLNRLGLLQPTREFGQNAVSGSKPHDANSVRTTTREKSVTREAIDDINLDFFLASEEGDPNTPGAIIEAIDHSMRDTGFDYTSVVPGISHSNETIRDWLMRLRKRLSENMAG